MHLTWDSPKLLTLALNPWAYKEEGNTIPPPPTAAALKVSLEFFRDELSFTHAIFSSCEHIPRTHFNASLLRIGCYGYEIWHHLTLRRQGGIMPAPIRLLFNFSKTIYHHHLPVSVAVGVPHRHILTQVW